MSQKAKLFPLRLLMMVSALRAESDPVSNMLADGKERDAVKTVGLCILAQANPGTAEAGTTWMQNRLWATDREALYTKDEQAEASAKFLKQWSRVGDAVKTWHLKEIQFVGLDRVLLWSTQDWYFSGLSSRGPILIKVSTEVVHGELFIRGIDVYTDWGQIKSLAGQIQYSSAAKQENLFNMSLNPPGPATQPTP